MGDSWAEQKVSTRPLNHCEYRLTLRLGERLPDERKLMSTTWAEVNEASTSTSTSTIRLARGRRDVRGGRRVEGIEGGGTGEQREGQENDEGHEKRSARGLLG